MTVQTDARFREGVRNFLKLAGLPVQDGLGRRKLSELIFDESLSSGDVQGLPAYHFLISNRNRTDFGPQLEEAVSRARDGQLPVLLHRRRDRGLAHSFAVMELQDFAELVKRAEK